MRVGLVVNPTAGGGRSAALGRAVGARLRDLGHRTIDLSAPTAVAATARARDALPGLDVLAVVGGDGMAHLGVNVLAGSGTPLAVVAAGTGNDIARALDLPLHDAEGSARTIDAAYSQAVDAARLVGEPRWFAGVLGAGFDTLVNERANSMRWPRGAGRYPVAIARELPFFRPVDYRLEVDGVVHRTEAMLVAVANVASYGGGMRVCPDARADDGVLDVLVLHRVSRLEFLRVFPRVYRGSHVDHPAVEILRGVRVGLRARGIVGYADGERWQPLPLTVEAVPGALRVLVPPPPPGHP